MAITEEDLRDFNRFVGEKLENGGVNSLVQLAGEWEAQRHAKKEHAADGSGIDVDVDAKTLRSLAAAFPEVDNEEMLRSALSRRGGVTTAQMLAKAAVLAEKASRE